VTFSLDGATYAFDVDDVVEVAVTGDVTPVPGTSERVAGVTSWRGRTIPVLRIRADLKRTDDTSDQRCRLIVLRRPEPFAVRVDSPGQILRDWAAVSEPTPDADRETRLLVRRGEELVRVLDPVRIAGVPRTLLGPPARGEG
jgi:chemotaxis signal transduction protein